jgi:Ribonuclease G/E
LIFKARVRGIYSTAITKLLLDNGFEIVQPSLTIKERFKLAENMKSPDIDIYDRHSRQGVHVVGTTEALETLKTLLQKHLVDVIVRKQSFPIDGIYKGVVKEDKQAEHFVSVDVGPVVGKLYSNEIAENNPSSILVQVQRRQTHTREPLLSTKISIPGEYAILISEKGVRASLKIRDMQKRASLIELGRKIAPPDSGVIWRTTAATQPPEALEDELDRLAKTREELLRISEEKIAPALLWGNQYYVNVEFPALSKASFDEFRAEVAPTIKGHHQYKACERVVSAALEMAEKMLEGGALHEEVKRLFQQTIETEYPAEDSVVGIEHVKPNGRVYHLGKARIEKSEGDELRYSRVFRSQGFYDGLGTSKEPGDRAVTEARVGDWHYTTRYFSKDGVYKGAHINLNTPLELYPRWIRYVDLEVDICALPDGTVKVLDEDELKKAVTNGFVSEKLAVIVRERVSKILKNFADTPVPEN